MVDMATYQGLLDRFMDLEGKMHDMVPRSRIAAIEAEKTQVEQVLKDVQKYGHAEITRLEGENKQLTRDAGMWRKLNQAQEFEQVALHAWKGRDPERVQADLQLILRAFDQGIFVRDISHDHESGWAIRQLPFLAALGRLSDQFTGSEGPAAHEANDILGKPGYYKP